MMQGAAARGPTTATRRSALTVEGQDAVVGQQHGHLGRRPPEQRQVLGGLRLRTDGRRLVRARRAGPGSRAGGATAASRSASSTSPAATASTTVGPSDRPGPGISRSRPAPSADEVSTMANQSVITRPSKPHSPRSTSRQQCGLLGEPPTVEPVVGGHDPEGTALLHRQLEGQQVQLAEGALVDHRVDRAPLELGVVADEVLHRGEHAVGLHARGRSPRPGDPTAVGPPSSTRSSARRAATGGG